MIDPKSQVELSEKISDNDLDIVVGGRKAGGDQQEFGGEPPRPPDLVDRVVAWIKGLLS